MDTVETRIAAWLRTFEESGIAASHAQVAKLIGSDGRRLASIVAESSGHPIDSDRAEEIDRRSGDIYSELNTEPKVLPGAIELLRALEEHGVRWAIATSSRREQVDASIQALALSTPPTIVDGSHVEHAKPAPDLLLLAARELGVEPSLSWYVGDSVWDMQSAGAAGMRAIGVASGSATAEELVEAGASFTVDDLAQLLPFARGPAHESSDAAT